MLDVGSFIVVSLTHSMENRSESGLCAYNLKFTCVFSTLIVLILPAQRADARPGGDQLPEQGQVAGDVRGGHAHGQGNGAIETSSQSFTTRADTCMGETHGDDHGHITHNRENET